MEIVLRPRPLVSVIIPCYNAAEFVAEAVGSALAQTHSPVEIIVVNDGSPDTEELERVLQPFRSRIRYVEQENTGIAGARNAGLREAQGEFVGFLDADDLWEPTFVDTQLTWLSGSPEADLVYCDAILFGPEAPPGKTGMDLSPSHGEATLVSVLEGRCVVLTSSVLARLDSVRRAGGFDPARRLCEDFDLWVRMLLNGAIVVYHDARLVRRRLHGASLSAEPLAMVEAGIRVLHDVLLRPDLAPTAAVAASRHLRRLEYERALAWGKRDLVGGAGRDAARHLWTAAWKGRRPGLGVYAAGLWVLPAVLRPIGVARLTGLRDDRERAAIQPEGDN